MIARVVQIGCAAFLIGCTASFAVEPPDPVQLPPLPESAPPTYDAAALTIVAVGDVMPGSLTPILFTPDPADHHIPAAIRGVIGEADLVFGNLEGAFATENMAPVKCRPETREARRCFEFGFPPFLAGFLRDAGFTVMSLDNNHADDYGPAGYVLTQALLTQHGLTAVPKRTSVTLPARGLKVAVVPFGFTGGSYHIADLTTAQTVVAEASQRADVVVVSFHGGAEGENAVHVVDATEEYFGENRGNVVRFAHAVVDAGADLVLGHGPHVPRAVELYRERLIVYSLGNFWTYGNISIKGPKGIMPLLRVSMAQDGTFRAGRLVSLRQRLPGIPEEDPEGAAVRLIAALSAEDFPANPIRVADSGDLLGLSTAGPQEPDGTEICREELLNSGCTAGDSSVRD